MDRKVPKKNNKTKRILYISLPVVFLISLFVYSATRKRATNINRTDVTIREVKQGQFEDLLILNGKIEPLHSNLINVVEGGAVKYIYVEDGSMVTKGQKLLEVYNPNSELNYLQQETAMIEQINNLQTTKLSLRNQELDLEKELIQIEHDYVDAHKQFVQDTALYNAEVLARRDFEKSTENYRYQSKRKDVIRASVTKEKEARTKQIQGINQSLVQMQQSLSALRDNRENFVIKALASGRLSSFDAVLGQHINSGESIGKIDILDGYKLVVRVSEFYISKIATGQEGTIKSNDKNYNVIVSKVLPEVTNGLFTVELIFQNETPENLQVGRTFSIKLYLSESEESLLLSKGRFFEETSGKWVFVLTSDNKAERRNVVLGRENPVYYEVKSGLEKGDRVITSNYANFKTNEVLHINE